MQKVLFGDLPITEWPSESNPPAEMSEPWSSFVRARNYKNAGKQTEYLQTLRGILAMPDLESRHYLQAWHFLREADVQPGAGAKRIYGVIVEVAMPEGLDIVAAYADHTARYYNYSGAGVVWERPDDSLNSSIDALLQEAQALADKIGPWEQPRRIALPKNEVRINMLTPSGLHFGQGAMNIMTRDIGGQVFARAATLMQELINKTSKP